MYWQVAEAAYREAVLPLLPISEMTTGVIGAVVTALAPRDRVPDGRATPCNPSEYLHTEARLRPAPTRCSSSAHGASGGPTCEARDICWTY
ncbi:Uu.00g131370.m01.CDS01 [Anthostomella pinea]|uniref:Uu.00g131370.m01.CDS01 n=1 Tax=Anthostomella pinea TaxID=933095 RepID=A0AAI8YFV0_9PEZI|nr:Uu.00g131370.m01.CDS01 [Anthostomella pinea]